VGKRIADAGHRRRRAGDAAAGLHDGNSADRGFRAVTPSFLAIDLKG
jgi:hypothetical protein